MPTKEQLISQEEFFEKYNILQENFDKTGLSWNELNTIYEDVSNKKASFEDVMNNTVHKLMNLDHAHSIRYRLKDPEHLIEKIIRKKIEGTGDKKFNIDTYLDDMDDIIGVRVLHLYKDEGIKLISEIKKIWTKDKIKEGPIVNLREGDSEKDYSSKNITVEKNRRGYRSIHLVVKTSDGIEDSSVEIQIRTIFEEGWCEIDHKTKYSNHSEEDPLNESLQDALLALNTSVHSADEFAMVIKNLEETITNQEATLSKIINGTDDDCYDKSVLAVLSKGTKYEGETLRGMREQKNNINEKYKKISIKNFDKNLQKDLDNLFAESKYTKFRLLLSEYINKNNTITKKELAKFHYFKSITYEEEINYPKALEESKKAVKLYKSNPQIFIAYGEILYRLAKYASAIEAYEKALEILEEEDDNEVEAAIAYNNIGGVWDAKGDTDKALEYYEKALKINLKSLGDNHPTTATSYNNIGSAWDAKGDTDKALEYYEKALKINLKSLGDNHPTTATSYNNIGFAWNAKGDTDKALEYYEKALKIRLKSLGDNHPTTATSYNNIGFAWNAKGDTDKALEYYEKALKIRLKSLGDNHPTTATSYNNIGGVWDAKGDTDKALEYYEKALKINLKSLGDNHPTIATSYNNIGGVWDAKGDTDKALEYYEKALKINLKSLGDNHPTTATSYNNIGSAWDAKGDTDKALEYYEKALKIRLKSLGDNHPTTATSYNNIGGVWDAKGDTDKALEYYEKALKINLKSLGDNHPTIATSYNNIGGVWDAKGDTDKALEYYEKALKINLKSLGDNHPTTATSYNNIGSAWDAKGDTDKALEYCEKALKINLKSLGDNHPTTATSYNNIGSAWDAKGDTDKALEYYEKALKIRLKSLGDNHPTTATSYNNIGLAWKTKGDTDKALEYYEKALKILPNEHPNIITIKKNLELARKTKH